MAWAAIAAGGHDDKLRRDAADLVALGRPLWVGFHHEPEDDQASHGTPEEYAAASRRVHDVVTAAGAVNVVWVWPVMGAPTWWDVLDRFYPGDDVIDWVGYDPYNWWGYHPGAPWRSFPEIVRPFYAWLHAHGYGDKPFMLGEFAAPEDPADPARKPAWLADAAASFASFPNIRAYLWFDQLHRDDGYAEPRDWRIDTSPASLAAYISMMATLSALSCTGETAPPASPGAGTALQFALAQLGDSYVWGATGPDAYDCSGLMWSAYRAAGITIPRVSRDQYAGLPHVPAGSEQPGDLVFFDHPVIGHVGMVLDPAAGTMVQAPRTGDVVKISNYRSPRPPGQALVGFARPVPGAP